MISINKFVVFIYFVSSVFMLISIAVSDSIAFVIWKIEHLYLFVF